MSAPKPGQEVIEIKLPESPRRRRRYREATTPEGQEKRNANLIPFKKGQSGNPKGGKSKTQQLASIIRSIGSEEIDEQTGWTRIDAVIRMLYQEALKGKVPAAQLLFERGWGKVPQAIDIDVKTEVTTILDNLGMTMEEAMRDPLMRQLLDSAGISIENNEMRFIEDGPDDPITEGEGGANPEAGGAVSDSQHINSEQPGPGSVD